MSLNNLLLAQDLGDVVILSGYTKTAQQYARFDGFGKNDFYLLSFSLLSASFKLCKGEDNMDRC